MVACVCAGVVACTDVVCVCVGGGRRVVCVCVFVCERVYGCCVGGACVVHIVARVVVFVAVSVGCVVCSVCWRGPLAASVGDACLLCLMATYAFCGVGPVCCLCLLLGMLAVVLAGDVCLAAGRVVGWVVRSSVCWSDGWCVCLFV